MAYMYEHLHRGCAKIIYEVAHSRCLLSVQGAKS